MQIKPYSNALSSRDLVDLFCGRNYGFALDSTQLVDSLGGWSFYGSDPFEVLTGGDDLFELRKLMSSFSNDAFCEIPFLGGAVGFISYDYGRCLETIPSVATNDLAIPNYCFGLYDGIVAKNTASGEVFLIASEVRESAEETFGRLIRLFNLVDSKRKWMGTFLLAIGDGIPLKRPFVHQLSK